MNAAQAILAQAVLYAHDIQESEPARRAFPWFWVILAFVAAVGLVWYFSYTHAGRGGPPNWLR